MVQQIMVCLTYCARTDRKCVIDTVRSPAFEHDIFELFDISHSHIAAMSPAEFYAWVKATPALTINPSVITHDVIDSILPVNNGRFSPNYEFRGVPAFIDPTRLYYENVLCHFNCGGGPGMVTFLKSFSPRGTLLEALIERYASLGSDYLAVHIRNTDYRSDIEAFLDANRAKINRAEKVFLASDSLDTVNRCREEFGDNINTFAKLGIGRHSQHHRSGKSFQFAIDAFCDFILLTLGKDYIYSCAQSGFSRNALSLFMDAAYREKYRTLITS